MKRTKRDKKERGKKSIKCVYYQLSHKIILQNTSAMLLSLCTLCDICCFFYKIIIVNITDKTPNKLELRLSSLWNNNADCSKFTSKCFANVWDMIYLHVYLNTKIKMEHNRDNLYGKKSFTKFHET